MSLSILDATFIGTVLEGVFYGLYCFIFILYIRVHTSRKSADRNHLIYPIASLFVLCSAYFIIDFSQQYSTILHTQTTRDLAWYLSITKSAIYCFIDFIAQAVLIYRCWVVWSQRLFVIAIPSISAIISLGISLTLIGKLAALGMPQNAGSHVNIPIWYISIANVYFSLSLVVNAIITGLLVFKITSVALRSSPTATHLARRTFNDFQPLVFMLIESGIALFVIQMVWVICFNSNGKGYVLIAGLTPITYGIIPTSIVVRVRMRHTPDTDNSSESNLQFAFADQDSNSPETPKIAGSTITCQYNYRA